jgi:type IV pilus assembly protein PilP
MHATKGVIAVLLVMLLAGCLPESDTRDLEQFVLETQRKPPARELDPLPELEPYQPVTYEAENLKDPFALSRFVVDATTRREPIVDSGIRPDTDRPQEPLENYALGALRFVGTFQDPMGGRELWALIRAPDEVVHRVQIGNYIGENYGEIYNIAEDRIDIQEIVRDPATGAWQERLNALSLVQ